MNLTLKLTVAAIFIFYLLLSAIQQAKRIKAGKSIEHFYEGAVYVVLIGTITGSYIWGRVHDHLYLLWKIPIIGIVCRLAFFDILLNLVRGKRIFYNGKGTTSSITDHWENNLSETWVGILKAIYIIVFIIIIIYL